MPKPEAIEAFRNDLVATTGFMDEEGVVHHEFNSGVHGLKMNFGVIKKGSALYKTWVELSRDAIREAHPDSEELFIIGVESGTTDLAYDVAEAIGHSAVGLRTEKHRDKTVHLTLAAKLVLQDYMRTKLATTVVIDDVGTTGGVSGAIALECLESGAGYSEVQYAWRRSPRLPFLETNNISHSALIKEVIPSMSPEECLKNGDCSRGVQLIPHGN